MGNQVKPLEEQLQPGKAIPLYQDIEIQFQGNAAQQLKEFDTQSMSLTESAEVVVSEKDSSKTKAKLVKSNGKRKLIVTVEGIHTGMTKNMTFYPGNALEESVPTWTSPYNKPVIKNHNLHSEPLGRIVRAEYVESTLTDKYTVRLTLEITDQEAIEKILDGRYQTLSVGGSANKVTCSVCAKDLVQEGFCGHWRGRKYEGKTAHWIIGNYTGDEISFVNLPADVHSQVIAKELVSEGGSTVSANNSADTQTQESQQENTTPVTEDNDLDIDNILNEGQQAPSNEEPNQEPPVQVSEGDNQGDNPEHNGDPVTTTEGEQDNQDASLQEQLDAANERIKELERQLEEANSDNVTLSADISERDSRINDLEKKLEESANTAKIAEQERDTFKKQNLSLAKYVRKTLAERVVDLRILKGKNQAEEREALMQEWESSSVKVLQSTIEELLKAPREQATITSPGLAIEDKNSTIIDDQGEEIKPKESKKKVTLADLEESMVEFMAKNNY